MSVERYCSRIRDSSLSPADQQWFPAWIRRYAEATKTTHGPLPVTREGVIDFLRMLRDRGTPAWQRLQATRAIEAYQMLVLGEPGPSLQDIRMKRLDGKNVMASMLRWKKCPELIPECV